MAVQNRNELSFWRKTEEKHYRRKIRNPIFTQKMILSVLPAKLYCGKRFKSGFIPFFNASKCERWELNTEKMSVRHRKEVLLKYLVNQKENKLFTQENWIFFRVKGVGINAQNIPKKQLFSLSLTSNSKFLHQKKQFGDHFEKICQLKTESDICGKSCGKMGGLFKRALRHRRSKTTIPEMSRILRNKKGTLEKRGLCIKKLHSTT